MTGILAKIRIIALGNAHDVLGKIIDMNSPSALRQYIRDLETAMVGLGSEKGCQVGHLTTITRERDTLQAETESLPGIITKLLAGGHEDIARTKAVRLNAAKGELESKNQEVIEQQAQIKSISQTYSTLTAKHQEMLTQLHQLEHLDRESKANEQSAAALKGISNLMGGGVDISVDNIREKIVARNDVSKAQLNEVMGSIPQPEEDPLATEVVDDILNSLRPKPAKTEKPEAPAATATA